MKKKVDLSVYLIAGPIHGRNLFDVVHKAVKGGVTVVQLRDKTSEIWKVVDSGRGLKKLLKAFGIPLIVNDRIDVAMAVEADGVHLGTDDMEIVDARQLLGSEAIIGYSLNSVDKLRKCYDIQTGNCLVDYLGVGPLYKTNTKTDCGAVIGLSGFTNVRGATAVPLVAIGGLNPERTEMAVAAGANGVAISEYIMGSLDPTAASEEIFLAVQRGRSS